MLTVRAEVGAAAGDENAANRCAADQARLAGAEVDFVFELEKALLSGRIDIVRNRGTSRGDRLPQYSLDGVAQPLEFLRGQAAGLASRANAGAKQAFIGVNVADSMEKLLIQQCGFDGGSTPAKKRSKRVC